MGTGICPWCGKTVDKFIMFRGDVVGCRYCGIHTKQTNADRIRSMTDDELAEFLYSIGQNPVTGNTYLNGKFIFFCGAGNGWLDWLKQEATDG